MNCIVQLSEANLQKLPFDGVIGKALRNRDSTVLTCIDGHQESV